MLHQAVERVRMFFGGSMQNIYLEILEATKYIGAWAIDCEKHFNEFFHGDGSYGVAQIEDLAGLNFSNIRCVIETGLGIARNDKKQAQEFNLGQCMILLKSIEKAIEQRHALNLYESFWELHMLCECAAEEEFYLYSVAP